MFKDVQIARMPDLDSECLRMPDECLLEGIRMPPPTTCKVKKLSFPLVRFLAAGSFARRAGQDIERESSRIRLTMFAVLDRSTQTLGTCNRQQLQTNLIFDFL